MNKEKKLESLLIIAGGFILLFLALKLNWLLLIALLVALLGAISDFFADKITWVWFKIAEILGWINTRILLGFVFYVFLSPIAFFMRIMNKGAIKLKKEKVTYYAERNHTYTNADLENTW
jgi:hypothetical protein